MSLSQFTHNHFRGVGVRAMMILIMQEGGGIEGPELGKTSLPIMCSLSKFERKKGPTFPWIKTPVSPNRNSAQFITIYVFDNIHMYRTKCVCN